MKLTIPTSEILSGQPLQAFYDDLIKINSELSVQTDNGNVIINDNNATVKIVIDEAELLNVLSAGGEVEEHLMSIHATDAIKQTEVPDTLPHYKFADGSIKKFIEWFVFGSEAWVEDGAPDGIMFRSNPLAGLVGPSGYLTGSQMKIIKDLNGSNEILTNAEADVITAGNWTKIVW